MQDYPVDFSTPPLPIGHLMPPNSNNMGPSGGTLRRGMRGIVPPDVTHHTNHSKSTHDIQNSMSLNASQQTMNNVSNNTMSSQLSSNSSMTAPGKPQGILKDPNRKQQSHQLSNMQILNVQNAPGVGNSLLLGIGTYDPNTHNLSSFNAQMGYTDADGHLV